MQSRQLPGVADSCMSTSKKQSAQTSTVKSTALHKIGGQQRNLGPCSETLRTCLAEKSLRSPLSIPCGLFGCEDNTSTNDWDCVNIKHSCAQCYCTTQEVGPVAVASGKSCYCDFHRKQLRSLIGINWWQIISNAKLYERCRCRQINVDMTAYIWPCPALGLECASKPSRW